MSNKDIYYYYYYYYYYFFTVLKTYHPSYFTYKHDAIDIADPSSMKDAWASLAIESLWLSGRALKRGIRMSKVPLLMTSQSFSLSYARDKTTISFSVSLPSLPSPLFYLQFLSYSISCVHCCEDRFHIHVYRYWLRWSTLLEINIENRNTSHGF